MHVSSFCGNVANASLNFRKLTFLYIICILYMFRAFVRMLQILALILENSSFSCIIGIFLNKVLLEIKTFSSFVLIL